MRLRHLRFLLTLACAGALTAFANRELGDTASAPSTELRWQARVDRYLENDEASPPPIDGIVFTGSSSIDQWAALPSDFPDLPVVKRGIGCTLLANLPDFAPMLVYPLQPRVVVVYAGENDLQHGRASDEVVATFEQVRAQIHQRAPRARMIFLSIKPCPSRRALLPAIRDANARIADACEKEPRCTFIDIFTPMLDINGNPRGELFCNDNLHMNATGYALWTKLVSPVLHEH